MDNGGSRIRNYWEPVSSSVGSKSSESGDAGLIPNYQGCTLRVGTSLSWVKCGAPAILAIEHACVHEHVSWAAVCEEHDSALELLGPDGAACAGCFEGPEGHTCMVWYERRTLAEFIKHKELNHD